MHHARRHAFSLIEAAIVLGIIGAVLGGLWVAASSVSSNMKVNATLTGINEMVIKINQLFYNSALPASLTTINDALIATNIAPPDWQKGSTLIHPWGGALSVDIRVSPMLLRFYLSDVSGPACIKLARALLADPDGNTYGSQGLMQVIINWSNYLNTYSPPSQITSRCGTGGLVELDFMFPWTGSNTTGG